MKACDICGAQDQALVDLLAEYQTRDIKEICHPCEAAVNDQLWKIRMLSVKMNTSMLQRFMNMLRGRKTP